MPGAFLLWRVERRLVGDYVSHRGHRRLLQAVTIGLLSSGGAELAVLLRSAIEQIPLLLGQ